jgi:hypothetical protein
MLGCTRARSVGLTDVVQSAEVTVIALKRPSAVLRTGAATAPFLWFAGAIATEDLGRAAGGTAGIVRTVAGAIVAVFPALNSAYCRDSVAAHCPPAVVLAVIMPVRVAVVTFLNPTDGVHRCHAVAAKSSLAGVLAVVAVVGVRVVALLVERACGCCCRDTVPACGVFAVVPAVVVVGSVAVVALLEGVAAGRSRDDSVATDGVLAFVGAVVMVCPVAVVTGLGPTPQPIPTGGQLTAGEAGAIILSVAIIAGLVSASDAVATMGSGAIPKTGAVVGSVVVVTLLVAGNDAVAAGRGTRTGALALTGPSFLHSGATVDATTRLPPIVAHLVAATEAIIADWLAGGGILRRASVQILGDALGAKTTEIHEKLAGNRLAAGAFPAVFNHAIRRTSVVIRVVAVIAGFGRVIDRTIAAVRLAHQLIIGADHAAPLLGGARVVFAERRSTCACANKELTVCHHRACFGDGARVSVIARFALVFPGTLEATVAKRGAETHARAAARIPRVAQALLIANQTGA